MESSDNPYHYVYGNDILPVAKHPEVPVFWTYTIEPIPRPKEADVLAVDTPFYVDMRWFMEAPMQVYGYTTESPYPEDQRQEDRIWEERQQVRVAAFSEAAMEGELGWITAEQVEAITEDEFHAAYERGWTKEEV